MSRSGLSVVTTVVQQGPFDATSAAAALTAYPVGTVLYETNAAGNVIAEWVKSSA